MLRKRSLYQRFIRLPKVWKYMWNMSKEADIIDRVKLIEIGRAHV